jgi:beta-lactamase class A
MEESGDPAMKKTLTAALAAVLFSGPACAADSDGINAFLKDLAVKLDLSKACVSIVDLRGPAPRRGGWRDTEIKPVASVIKLNLMAGAYAAAAEGVSFGSEIIIKQDNWTGTWDPDYDGIPDPNPPLKVGSTWTLEKLVEVMIRRSDNVATNTLIDFLDRKKVTDFVQGAGLAATHVRHKLSSGNNVADPAATGFNQMPARDAATLLALVAQGKLVSPAASAAMYATLAGQLDRELIAEALPPGAVYAGKTGELSAARNDAAIIRAPGLDYVLVVYTQLPGPQGKPLIRAITAAVHDFLVKNP